MRQTGSTLFARREPSRDFRRFAAPRRLAPPEPPPRIDDRLAALPDDYARAKVGAYADLGEKVFSAAYIRAYAQEFDPFPFHLDEAAGKNHVLGAMSAAGLQTACCWMRQFIALRREAAGGEVPSRASPGFANMVWRKPVLVGDRIRFSTQVIAKRPISKPGLGLVQSLNSRRQPARRAGDGFHRGGDHADSPPDHFGGAGASLAGQEKSSARPAFAGAPGARTAFAGGGRLARAPPGESAWSFKGRTLPTRVGDGRRLAARRPPVPFRWARRAEPAHPAKRRRAVPAARAASPEASPQELFLISGSTK